jgi:hypothetical protein
MTHNVAVGLILPAARQTAGRTSVADRRQL